MKSVLVRKPANVTFDQAASAPVAALTALQGLRDKGRIRQGQKVLINGAAGGVGTFAVQMAKSFAANVTGVCSTTNLDMVRSIGADCVIDYTKEDFTRSGQRYDLVLDCVGNHSLSACRRVSNPKGILVMVGAPDDSPSSRLLARLHRARFLSRLVREERRVLAMSRPPVLASRRIDSVSILISRYFAAQCSACMCPCQRFMASLSTDHT